VFLRPRFAAKGTQETQVLIIRDFRQLSDAFLLRFGNYIGRYEGRITLSQYPFMDHGSNVAFGRFLAVLRFLASFPAVNQMALPRFLVANAVDGIYGRRLSAWPPTQRARGYRV
jgi:hypothetical protein